MPKARLVRRSWKLDSQTKQELVSLFEATYNGTKPIEFSNGDTLECLHDGDETILGASCGGGEGQPRLGFGECCGECCGKVLPVK
ncbi:hypothetical protein PMAA_040900 [Talaromyces marneffei ATCC 18224]|uniref:Uncharacterized protein n=1 Tax=Talaromyces marneffei (strain ATCC 18224 / CBS 334.59 / QM 7333) TaxID=441960 RepID=B6QQ88_TALMQ|nr:hypothetical protein PMAA_040900 [Talaromyces marneffei ATCC 18224]